MFDRGRFVPDLPCGTVPDVVELHPEAVRLHFPEEAGSPSWHGRARTVLADQHAVAVVRATHIDPATGWLVAVPSGPRQEQPTTI